MLNVSSWEVTMILIAALLLLGPSKLPEFARWVGRVMREVRKVTQEVRESIDMELEKEELNRLKAEFSDELKDYIEETDQQFKAKVAQVQQDVDQQLSLDPKNS